MTVPNWRTRQVEKIQYFTPDGEKLDLHDPPKRAVMLYEGDGLLSPEADTTRGPFQHGNTVTGFRLPPRRLDLLIRQNGCNRDDYWELRRLLTDLMRINRSDLNNPTMGTLRRVLSTGDIRDLDGYFSRGPLFEHPRNWDSFSIQETLEFTAPNPILYEPTIRTASLVDFTPPVTMDLVFPFLYSFIFGETITTLTKTISISYAGTWEEHPTLILSGPFDNFLIRHNQTGVRLQISNYSVPAGVSVTITLTYGRKSIVTSTGISLIGFLTTDSDLAAFSIQPDPLVANGLNTFDVTFGNGVGATAVQMQYKHRYAGI